MYDYRGGIQVFSQFFLQALCDALPQANLELFIKNDCRSGVPSLPVTHYHCGGDWPQPARTVAFASSLFIRAFKTRPALIITTHLHFCLAAYYLKKWLDIPYWTVAHGIESWNIEDPELQRALHHADRILAVSTYTRNRLLKEQNLHPENVAVLPNTFNPERFQIGPKPKYLLDRHHLTPSQPVIFTVTRLEGSEAYKGYDQILRCLTAIRSQLPNVRYLIGGKGPDMERVKQMIRDLGLQENVILLGFVSDEELPDYYNLCDVFTMPSCGEGFGIVFLEALSSGKPVLAGNKDGSVDALHFGDFGVLVDPEDFEQIGKNLLLILNKEHRHPLIYQPERLRESVIQTYGFSRFRERLSQFLCEADGHF